MNKAEAVMEIVAINGGRLVGKTRLQKTAYFLEAFGIGYGFDFGYHYYGPYSEELALAVLDAEALALVSVEHETSRTTGMHYAVFHATEFPTSIEAEGKRRELLARLRNYDATSLELAATADFLTRTGSEDPWEETRLRKSVKADETRLSKAKSLLAELEQLR